jgi:hypothetical protein
MAFQPIRDTGLMRTIQSNPFLQQSETASKSSDRDRLDRDLNVAEDLHGDSKKVLSGNASLSIKVQALNSPQKSNLSKNRKFCSLSKIPMVSLTLLNNGKKVTSLFEQWNTSNSLLKKPLNRLTMVVFLSSVLYLLAYKYLFILLLSMKVAMSIGISNPVIFWIDPGLSLLKSV